MTPPPAKRIWRDLSLRLAGSGLILALLFSFLPLEQLWRTVRGMPPALWFGVLAGYACAHLIGVMKWRLMVNLAGAGLSYPQAARCYFAGLFGNVFLPSLVGGDVIRAGLALRLGRSKAGVLLGSLLDRILDASALTIVALLGLSLLPGALDPRIARVFWAVLGTAGLGCVAAFALVGVILRRRFSYRTRRRLAKLRGAGRSLARKPARVLVALALGVAFQITLVLLMAQIALACGLFVPLRAWLFAFPLAKLSALLPITQGGIGVREAALAALLAPFGAPAVLTVATGLVWESIIISTGILGGLLSLWTPRPAPRDRVEVGVSSAAEKEPGAPSAPGSM